MFPLLQLISQSGRHLLDQGSTTHHFQQGASLLHQGQAVSGAYLVLAGQLRVYTLTPNGIEATLYVIEPGQTCILALNCVFSDLLYPAWVQADSAASVLVINGRTFRALFQNEIAVRDMTVRSLATMVFGLMAELQQIHACKLEQRLANLLLTRASASGQLSMTQQQIAQHLGTSREVVARLIRGFVEADWVHTSRGAIQIVQARALSNLMVNDS